MDEVETQLMAYIKLRQSEGALAVPELEVIGAVGKAHPSFFLYGLHRLRRRGVVNMVYDRTGHAHYFIGAYPSAELRESLGV